MGTDLRRMSVAVIGAGAAGCIAAIAAASAGARVVLYEKNDRIGRKLAATGNGRCNLTNLNQDLCCYHTSEDFARDAQKVNTPENSAGFFDEFAASLSGAETGAFPFPEQNFRMESECGSSVSECTKLLIRLFNSFGLFFHERQGYVYPRTDSAAAVVQILERKLRSLGVDIRCGEDVLRIESAKIPPKSVPGARFKITAGTEEYVSSVVLACGSPAGPHLGADDKGYRFAEGFGHHIERPLPALTSLTVNDKLLRTAGGVRCEAKIEILCGGRAVPGACECGELQITGEGISGIPVLQLSRSVSLLMKEKKEDIAAIIDFLPEFDEKDFLEVKKTRISGACGDDTLADIFTGLVHPKIASYIIRRQGYADEKKIRNLPEDGKEEIISGLLDMLRNCLLPIKGTGGFEKAQAACGGVVLSELRPTMESRFCSGLYIAGEMTDIDGRCGGYNLTYAFCSGYTAGLHAAKDGT